MTATHFWDALWFTLFPLVLVGAGQVLLPATPAFQLAFLPIWLCYWLLTRAAAMGCWCALWCGILLETAWGVPPGCCVLAFLTLWQLTRLFRKRLPAPNAIKPLTGLILGTLLVPVLRLWLWLYALLWLDTTQSNALAPSLMALIAAPALGALMGGAVFALARAFDFTALRPLKEEVINDGR